MSDADEMRCDRCKYWVHGDQWGTKSTKGSCHRYAPQGTLGEWHYEVLRMLWMLAAQTVEEDDKDQDWEMHWEEAAEQAASWPQTTASDWCGEFAHGRNRADVAPVGL